MVGRHDDEGVVEQVLVCEARHDAADLRVDHRDEPAVGRRAPAPGRPRVAVIAKDGSIEASREGRRLAGRRSEVGRLRNGLRVVHAVVRLRHLERRMRPVQRNGQKVRTALVARVEHAKRVIDNKRLIRLLRLDRVHRRARNRDILATMRTHLRVVHRPAVRDPLRRTPAAVFRAIVPVEPIDPLRLVRLAHVPFARVVHLVPALAQACEQHRGVLEGIVVQHRARLVAVPAREERGPGRRADGRGGERAVERNARGRERGEVRRADGAGAAISERVGALLVRQNQQHVRLLRRFTVLRGPRGVRPDRQRGKRGACAEQGPRDRLVDQGSPYISRHRHAPVMEAILLRRPASAGYHPAM